MLADHDRFQMRAQGMRTVVITGSGSGLGAAIRARLEADGASVLGVDLPGAGQEVEADLSTPLGRRSAINGVLVATGRSIDGVVVCAGVGPHVKPASRLVSVNYFGAVEVLDGLRPALADGVAPSAVAVSSNVIGLLPIRDPTLINAMLLEGEAAAVAIADRFDGGSVYVMTKIALARAVRHRVVDWGRAGVRLNAVAPGPVLTALLQGSLDDPVLGPSLEALPIPIGRRGEPEDIAAVVAFLLDPSSSFVHGSILFVDGGTDALVRPDVV
jgi:NAD(P)-dependent dehydrogenase (short-subunit alcohol dehydrogenase family)